MAERNEHGEQNARLSTVRQLWQKVEALRRSLERNEERADSVAQDLVALEQALAGGCESKLSRVAPRASQPRRRTERSFLLELAAESGVQKLEVTRLANGQASIQIDGGPAFKLPATLSALLAVLAADTAKADGNLVGWKPISAVIGQLEKTLGRPFTPHAIHQLVSRLRAALAIKGGVNPFLVQSHRQYGLRFALRRQRGL